MGALALAAGVVAVVTATQLWDYDVHDLHVRVLDSASRRSYTHALSTLAFLAAAAAGALALWRGVRERRGSWHAATWLFAFLLVDNVTRIHEHVPHWPVVYLPILLAVSAALLVLSAGSDQQRLVVVGLGLLMSSLVIHVVGPSAIDALGWSPLSWQYQVKVALKEGLELAGWVVMVPVLLRLATGATAPRRA